MPLLPGSVGEAGAAHRRERPESQERPTAMFAWFFQKGHHHFLTNDSEYAVVIFPFLLTEMLFELKRPESYTSFPNPSE